MARLNYVPGQFETITDINAGVVSLNNFQYFALEGFFKHEVANPVIKVGAVVVPDTDYVLSVDEKYTAIEDGRSGETLISQIKFTNAVHDGQPFTVSGLNFGSMVDNDGMKFYVDEVTGGGSAEKYATYPVTTSGTTPEAYKTALVNASGGEVNLTLPAVTLGDERWYGFKLDENSNHCNLSVAGAAKVQGLDILSISTENATVIVKADGQAGGDYKLVVDTRLYNRPVLVTANKDLTSGFESGGIYYGDVPDAGAVVVTIKNWSIEHNGDYAFFTKIGGENSTYRVVSEDSSFDEIINDNDTGFRVSATSSGYTLSQDSRPKSSDVRISFLPTADPSVLDPTYMLLQTDSFAEQIYTSAVIPSFDPSNPTSLGFWLNDDKALIGNIEANSIIAVGNLKKTSSFNRNISIRFRYFQYDYDTLTLNPTPLLTTSYSQPVATDAAFSDVTVTGTLPSADWAYNDESFTNTLVIELQAIKSASGGDDPTLDVKMGGETPSQTYIDIPIASVNHNILGGVVPAATGIPDGHIDNSKPLQSPELTTAQRDAVTSPIEGMVIQNTTAGQLEEYQNGSWGAVGGWKTVYDGTWIPASADASLADEYMSLFTLPTNADGINGIGNVIIRITTTSAGKADTQFVISFSDDQYVGGVWRYISGSNTGVTSTPYIDTLFTSRSAPTDGATNVPTIGLRRSITIDNIRVETLTNENCVFVESPRYDYVSTASSDIKEYAKEKANLDGAVVTNMTTSDSVGDTSAKADNVMAQVGDIRWDNRTSLTLTASGWSANPSNRDFQVIDKADGGFEFTGALIVGTLSGGATTIIFNVGASRADPIKPLSLNVGGLAGTDYSKSAKLQLDPNGDVKFINDAAITAVWLDGISWRI